MAKKQPTNRPARRTTAASKPHKRIGGQSQEDIHEDITPPGARISESADRRDVMSSAMGGASDASSGAGAGAGIPGGGTDMRTGGRFDKGNVERDREKLFPEAKSKRAVKKKT